MSLNESFNTPNWKNHPIKTALDRNEEEGKSSDYMINATHFPKWFTNRKVILKKINDWKEIWRKECQKQGGILKRISILLHQEMETILNVSLNRKIWKVP